MVLHGISGGNQTGPDGLFAQGSVVAADGMVFAVNPGSNTFSQFRDEQPKYALGFEIGLANSIWR